MLIDRQPELQVIGQALDGLEAIELAGVLDPDAAVLDLHMPRVDGVMLKGELVESLVERLAALRHPR